MPDQLMTVADVAAYVRVDVRTVRRWLTDGDLPHARLGDGPNAHIRVDFRDLRAFLGFRDTADDQPVLEGRPNSSGSPATIASSYTGPRDVTARPETPPLPHRLRRPRAPPARGGRAHDRGHGRAGGPRHLGLRVAEGTVVTQRTINTAELQPDLVARLTTALPARGVDLDALRRKAAEYDELALKARQVEEIRALVTDAGIEITDDADLIDAVTVLAREANAPAEVARIVAGSDQPLPHTGRLAASALSTADAIEVQAPGGRRDAHPVPRSLTSLPRTRPRSSASSGRPRDGAPCARPEISPPSASASAPATTSTSPAGSPASHRAPPASGSSAVRTATTATPRLRPSPSPTPSTLPRLRPRPTPCAPCWPVAAAGTARPGSSSAASPVAGLPARPQGTGGPSPRGSWISIGWSSTTRPSSSPTSRLRRSGACSVRAFIASPPIRASAITWPTSRSTTTSCRHDRPSDTDRQLAADRLRDADRLYAEIVGRPRRWHDVVLEGLERLIADNEAARRARAREEEGSDA